MSKDKEELEKIEINNINDLNEHLEEKKTKRKQKRKRKAVFIERFLAFFIDTLIVSMACSLITMPFINNDNITDLAEREHKIEHKVQEIAKSRDLNKMVKESKKIYPEVSEIQYEISKESGAVSLILIVAEMLYFIVFQLYNNGQTIGKKLLKIKIVSTNSESLNPNQMLFRALIINSILFNIIDFAFMIFSNKYLYWPSVSIFNIIQSTVLLIIVFMVMFRKDGRGLHDLLCRTEVVKE